MSVNYDDLALFNRQLAHLVKGGHPLPESLGQVAKEVQSRKFKKILEVVQKEVAEGKDLGQALEKHEKDLPPMYIKMVHAGLEGGNLADVLENFAQYSETKVSLKKNLSEAMTYPLISLGFILPIFLFLLYFVAPQIVKTHEQMHRAQQSLHVESSTLTKIWYNASPILKFLTTYANLITFVLLALVIGLWILFKKISPDLQMVLPIFGTIYYQSLLALIIQSLASLLKCGVPLPRALELTAGAVHSEKARNSLENMARRAKEGEKLSESLKGEDFFPEYASWILEKDEGKERFAESVENLAHHYRNRVERRIHAAKIVLFPIGETILGIIVLASFFLFVLPLIFGPLGDMLKIQSALR